MTIRKSLAAALAVVLAVGVATTVHGWSGQRNTIKSNAALALPGTVLPAGEYEFEVVEGKPDVVRVSTADTHFAYYLGFTRSVTRPRSLAPGRAIVLGEAPAGSPKPIAVWYPTDGGDGHEFIYR